MKTLNSVLLVAVVGIMTSAASFAEMSEATRFKVPFAFDAAGISFAAGDYTVSTESQAQLVKLSALTGKQILLLDNHGGKRLNAGTKSVLVFHRYGDQFFLYQAAMAGADRASQFKQSIREKEISIARGAPSEVIVRAAD